MRGEEFSQISCVLPFWELPPHARRRALIMPEYSPRIGITSACAEKRVYCDWIDALKRNYLRMRGEEATRYYVAVSAPELPPHARRRAGFLVIFAPLPGITSACAEKRLRYLRKL